MTLIAAADGSALGNPGAAGWAWYISDSAWAADGSAHATNNQAELMGVLSLLQATQGSSEPLHILCDSRYVIDALTKWMPSWKRRGWKKADGKPVLNRALLEEISSQLADRSVTFEWVKGHAGHELNERVDDLARAAAEAFKKGRQPDRGPGFANADVSPSPEQVRDSEDFSAVAFELEHTAITPQVCERDATLVTPAGRTVRGDQEVAAVLSDETLLPLPRSILAAHPVEAGALLVVSMPAHMPHARQTSLWIRDEENQWRLKYRVCAAD